MKKDVVSIQPDATLLEAAQLLSKKHIGTLPVVDSHGKLVGLTSLRAIVRLFMPDFVQLVGDVDFVQDFGAIETLRPEDFERAETTTVADIMDEAVSVEDDCELARALVMMITHELPDLPVVRKGKLVGIASRVDIGRAFLENWLAQTHSPKSK